MCDFDVLYGLFLGLYFEVRVGVGLGFIEIWVFIFGMELRVGVREGFVLIYVFINF